MQMTAQTIIMQAQCLDRLAGHCMDPTCLQVAWHDPTSFRSSVVFIHISRCCSAKLHTPVTCCRARAVGLVLCCGAAAAGAAAAVPGAGSGLRPRRLHCAGAGGRGTGRLLTAVRAGIEYGCMVLRQRAMPSTCCSGGNTEQECSSVHERSSTADPNLHISLDQSHEPHTLLPPWLCRVSRLRGATQMYMVQNLGCAAAAATVLPLLQPAPPTAPWLPGLLIALSVVCGSLSGIGAAGSNWIVERQWPKALCQENSSALAALNAGKPSVGDHSGRQE
jgi:hypothetical protein